MIDDMRALGSHSSERYAYCVDNGDYPVSLELHKLYRVLPDEKAETYGEIRIMDESGEDYLYPVEYFALVQLPRSRKVPNPRAVLAELIV